MVRVCVPLWGAAQYGVCIHVSTTYVGLCVHVTISYSFLLVYRCCKYVHMPMNGVGLRVANGISSCFNLCSLTGGVCKLSLNIRLSKQLRYFEA